MPAKLKPALLNSLYQVFWDRIHAEAMEAGRNVVPVPMGVAQHANPLNDNSPVVKQWIVNEGPCGFAWVNIKPATHPFSKWLVAKGIASKDSYNGGIKIWVSEFGQSITRKECYAYKLADLIRAEIKDLKYCYGGSRMD